MTQEAKIIPENDGEGAAMQVSADTLYQQDKAVVDMQISTAKAYPRNIMRAIDNAIAIVTLDTETAQSCTYNLPRGGKNISGPSVHLAKIIAQTWGNMRIEAKVVSIEEKHVNCQAVAWDLESNIAFKVEVKRKITNKNGQRFNEDMITMTGNAGNAIALRNAIYAVIPRGASNKVYKAAIQRITGDVSDENKMKAKVKSIFDKITGAFNVTEAEVLHSIGKATTKMITADDIVALTGTIQAITDGDTDVDMAFRSGKVTAENRGAKATQDAEEKLKKGTK
jgi:hypothetical protein